MEGQLNFELRLSLEETVLRRIVVNLWSGADALASIESLRFELLPDDDPESGWSQNIERKVNDSGRWRETIESVEARVCELALPEPLKSRMMQIVRPIGSEALRWRLLAREAHLSDSRQDSLTHLQQLVWTPAGSVDCKRTAERLVRLQTTDVVKRYELACWYCLEKDIPALWQELPKEYKTSINLRLYRLSFETTPLDGYWVKVVEAEISRAYYDPLCVIDLYYHKHAFAFAKTRGNKAAAEYFLQKFANDDRNSHVAGEVEHLLQGVFVNGVRGSFPKEKLADLFFYLWSQMAPEEKVKVLQGETAAGIFGFMMYWPWQDLLLDSVAVVNSLSESSCGAVATSIGRRIDDGFCFPKLLQDFFFRSPVGFRNPFLITLLRYLFFGCTVDPDVDTIKEIFRNVDFGPDELAYSCMFTYLLVQLVKADKWDFAEVCLQEALRSTKSSGGLRENFEKKYIHCVYSLRESGRIERFYELLDKMEASANISKGSEC